MKLKFKELLRSIDAFDDKIYAAVVTFVLALTSTISILTIPEIAPIRAPGVVFSLVIYSLLYMIWIVREAQSPMHDIDAVMAQLGEISESLKALEER